MEEIETTNETKDLKSLLQNYQIPKSNSTSKRRSERGDLLEKFVEQLNADRVSAGYKKFGFGTYIKKMADAGIKSPHELYVFYKQCDSAKNFSSYWWWYIKEHKIKKNDSTN